MVWWPCPPKVYLKDACAINDQGWIAGTTNTKHAYLLTKKNKPIPPIQILLQDSD